MGIKDFFLIVCGSLALALGAYAAKDLFRAPQVPADTGDEPQQLQGSQAIEGGRVSGPYSHKNLSIYLIHGKDTLGGRPPISLADAMDRRLVKVHETGDVNELAIENISAKDEVFVQAGDIVKGGKQDRVLAVDLLVPARSGRLKIESFCVEKGRWTNRGSESTIEFSSSAEYAPSKELKLAAQRSKSQEEVWASVNESQSKLSAATNSNTASDVSKSSLPLTLEHHRVKSDSNAFVKALADIVRNEANVIGFVFAIDGRIISGDVYGSSELFTSLWPRLLKAAAIEAIAESSVNRRSVPNSLTEVRDFIDESATASIAEKRSVTDRVLVVTRESSEVVFIESFDQENMLHQSYLAR